MSSFRLLRDPDSYIADDLDMVIDTVARQHWLELFETHFEKTLKFALQQYGHSAHRRIDAARADFAATIESLRRDPSSAGGTLSVLTLCLLREKALRTHDLNNPFGHVKDRENAFAIELYPQVTRDIRHLNKDDQWLRLIEGVFAGNIFDLGSPSTLQLSSESPDFLATLEGISPRPWLVDDFDSLGADLARPFPAKWSKAIVLIDNAGSDFILGMMPLVRKLATGGVQIILAANELPTLNDLTADETLDIVDRLAAIDADLAALIDGEMLKVVSTGNGIPLIDLSDVSDELNKEADDADLLILEGMGRAIESNFNADFSVDCIRLALLKDPWVSQRIGGKVFDCICKYTPATEN